MKAKFFNALSLAVIMAMLLTSLALADDIVPDGDIVASGNNNPVNLGTVSPGAILSPQVSFTLVCSSKQHVDQGQAVNLTASAQNFPVNGSLSATNTSILPVPASWPDDTSGGGSTNCPSPAPTPINDNGNSLVSITAPMAAGSYTYVVRYFFSLSPAGNSDNQAIQGGDHVDVTYTLTVSAPVKTTPTITWANPADIVYGTALSGIQLNATASVSGTFVYTPAAGAVLNAGAGQTLHVDFTPDDTTNYNNASKDVSINVLKANPGCSISGYTGTYDGLAHGASGTCSGNGTLTLGDTFTNVPGGIANWTYTGDTNYNSDSGSVEIVITKAPAGCSVSGFTGVYDGDSHGASGSCTGGGTLDLGDSFTNVPGGTANWTFTGDGNYEDAYGSVQIVINKADASCSVTGYDVTYDGTEHVASGSCSGVMNEPLSGLDLSGTKHTDAGNYNDTWTFTDVTGNYNNTSDNVTDNIAKAPVTATAGNGSGTYNGSVQSPSACAVTGAYTGDLTCTNNPASVGPDAGTYGISPMVSGTGLSNFEITSVSGSYTINKADATINVSGYTGYYDGLPHCATGTATGVLSEDLSAGLNFGSCFTNVPGGTAHWTFSGGTNYNDASGDVSINILAWTLTGFYKPVDMPNPLIVWNTVKGGQTVPLKFNVYAGTVELTDVGVIKSFTATKVACSGSTGDEAPVEFTTTGGTSLRYDMTDGQFIQNWQTPKGAGVCYKVTMTTQDLSTIIAYFKTK